MRRLALLAAVTALAAAAPARAADDTVASVTDPTGVDAAGGRLVWSERDPATGRYRLMTRSPAGEVSAPAVKERSAPFDVDLGPGPSGRTVAVYSRCGSGCDLYLYDFGARAERRLKRPGSARSEFLPAIWHRHVAFVRRMPDRDHLYVQSLQGGAPREIRGGRGSYDEIDLKGVQVAFVRHRITKGGDGRLYELLEGSAGGPVARLLDRAASGLLSSVAIRKPRLVGGAVVYAVARFGAAGNRFLRLDLATGRSRFSTGRRGVLAAAFAAGRFFYLQTTFTEDPTAGCRADAGDPSTCALRLTPPVPFSSSR